MLQLIVEECSRSGAHITYHRIAELPVRIGRAFNSDIILSDPFVSPDHLIIEDSDDEGWLAVDQASDNGTFVGKGEKLSGARKIFSGDQLIIGRTILRIWSPSHHVPPPVCIPAQTGRTKRRTLSLLSILSSAFSASTIMFSHYLDTADQSTLISLFATILPLLALPLFWAGIWACAGFIIRRKSHYWLQLIVANGALIATQMLTMLTENIDYASSNLIAGEIFQYTGMALLSSILLFINLRLATGTADLRRAFVVLCICSGIVTAIALTEHAERLDNHITPEYSRSLKPPYARIARSVTLDQFINESNALFKKTGQPGALPDRKGCK